ncbi:PIG-L family deacetylase [Solitalea sp. MAHUQ-68]|uniref:PIG-L family deacetylase n=1 Tax=Solitalea agri TaxID=2953739 RepID=A0A9X2JCE4_9SPHI|nr:PIG-L family deacetylase [Solitalea agri]MCO4291700.1 PIG-L family deacetylase [Solitalea agri]
MRKPLFLLSFILFAFITVKAQQPKSLSSSEILLALKKLNTFGAALYVAAHPDDENTRLISWLANEKCVRTGYLSMTRGDGGQNLIGDQQGELLGLIRTQELLAARRIDGAEQFFTRANDFGFSKNPDETFKIWNKDSILADVVWTIRRFRPDIIITRFATDGSGGHGHHTASAILAEEAFVAAADPNRYPEQLKYVQPWQAKRLIYNNASRFWNPNADMTGNLAQEVGQFNPMLGKSYGELAGESRSMHKSQGFGAARTRGSVTEYFKPIKGSAAATDVFDDIDLSANRIEGAETFKQWIKKAQDEFLTDEPSTILSDLIQAYKALDQIKDAYWKVQKQKELVNLIIACSGIYLEATATDFSITPGQQLKISINAINRADTAVILEKINFPNGETVSVNKSLERDQLCKEDKVITLDPTTSYNNPYWLTYKHSEGMFTVKDQNLIGQAEAPVPLQVGFVLTIEGQSLAINRPVIYKWVDPVDGELYRPIQITPPVMINMDAKAYVFPSSKSRNIKIVLKAGKESCKGVLKLDLPSSWKSNPASIPFNLQKKDEEMDVSFEIIPPSENSTAIINAVATIDGNTYSKGETVIDYKHIPIQTLYPDAQAKVVRFNLNKRSENIGYIKGAGDDIPHNLAQLGYHVKMLTDDMLSDGVDLSVYDAIVIGVRAYNTNDRMKFYYNKLMNYVQNGGNLIVQYNTNNFLGGVKSEIGPFPFTISRDRVTDENAEIRFEIPRHRVLNSPNKITSDDFKGWIQERGIYFASDWDKNYETPISLNDPGENSSKGSTIITKYGKGYFVYTGLSFFRELPAGVPGAYRLFVNMIELGK